MSPSVPTSLSSSLSSNSADKVFTYNNWFYVMKIFFETDLQKLADFVFTVHDQKKCNFLDKAYIKAHLREALVTPLPSEDTNQFNADILDMALTLLDFDGDGYVSRTDFIQSVLSEPLVLHILGECIPPDNSEITFTSLMKIIEEITCE
ncbi:unnamed protein product [Trichobilharzia regenti]|nr:unnamed protein product [Trichobilharzia regenti]